LPLFYSPY